MFVGHSQALEDIVEEVVSNINETTLIPRAIRYRIQMVKSFAIPKVMSKASLIPVSSEPLKKLIAEHRRPKGPPSGAPCSSCRGKDEGNPWVDILMVILVSGIARGRVRTTTTTTAELPNIWRPYSKKETYSLSLPCTFLILDIPAMIN